MNDASFWAEAQARVRAIIDVLALFSKAMDSGDEVSVQYQLSVLRSVSGRLGDHFGKLEALAIISTDQEKSFLITASLANSLNGYRVLVYLIKNKPEEIFEFVGGWHLSLDFMFNFCRDQQKLSAMLN